MCHGGETMVESQKIIDWGERLLVKHIPVLVVCNGSLNWPMLDPNLTLFSPHINIGTLKTINLLFQNMKKNKRRGNVSPSLLQPSTRYLSFTIFIFIFDLNNCLITHWIIHNSSICHWLRKREAKHDPRRRLKEGDKTENKASAWA